METAHTTPQESARAHASHKVYQSTDGHAWVGEHWVGRHPRGAVLEAEVPAVDDQRWVAGVPSVRDVEVLTLSPFYPSGRLGACIEKLDSAPQFPNRSNHPVFEGCRAWMPIDMLDWRPCTGRLD